MAIFIELLISGCELICFNIPLFYHFFWVQSIIDAKNANDCDEIFGPDQRRNSMWFYCTQKLVPKEDTSDYESPFRVLHRENYSVIHHPNFAHLHLFIPVSRDHSQAFSGRHKIIPTVISFSHELQDVVRVGHPDIQSLKWEAPRWVSKVTSSIFHFTIPLFCRIASSWFRLGSGCHFNLRTICIGFSVGNSTKVSLHQVLGISRNGRKFRGRGIQYAPDNFLWKEKSVIVSVLWSSRIRILTG